MQRIAWALAVSCGVLVFAVNYTIERKFDRLRVFDQYNVVFDTDPPGRLATISHGTGERNFVHPNFRFIFSLPIRLTAKTWVTCGLARDGRAIRRSMGMLVVPLLSGGTAFLAFRLFLQLGFSIGNSCLMTLLGGGSFSQLIFGSVPDHFAVSGFILTISYLVAADSVHRGGKVRWGAWLTCGVLAASVTITNLISVGILFATTAFTSHRDNSRPIRTSALFLGLAGAITYTIAVLGLGVESTFQNAIVSHDVKRPAAGTDDKQAPDPGEVTATESFANSESSLPAERPLWRRVVAGDQKWMNRFWETNTSGKIVHIPLAIVNTLAPADVSTKDNVWGRGQRYSYQFTLEKSSGAVRTLLAAILLATGSFACLKRRGPLFALGVASLGILTFNFLLHALWGQEYFLYSQHWLVPLLVLLSGNLNWNGKQPIASTCALGLIIVCVMANSVQLLNEMFRILIFAT